MPYWTTVGLIAALTVCGVYGCVRDSFTGPGWRRGMVYGLCIGLIHAGIALGMSGVFNLPGKLWLWWIIEPMVSYLIGGAVLGLVSEKLDR